MVASIGEVEPLGCQSRGLNFFLASAYVTGHLFCARTPRTGGALLLRLTVDHSRPRGWLSPQVAQVPTKTVVGRCDHQGLKWWRRTVSRTAMEVLLTLFASLAVLMLVLAVVGWMGHAWSLLTVLGCLILTVFAGVVVVSWRRGSFDVKAPRRKR